MQAIELIDLARTTPATKRAVKVVIATGQRSKQVLLVQVLRDGSLVIDPAPKCTYRPWTYGYLTMPPGGIVDGSLQMFPESQTLETELPPKFTFHPSGIVTMGKTGRLYSIRNPMDLPLAEARGHIFTIMARGLDGFADEPRESAKYRYVGPSATEPLDTFRISGHIGPLGQWLNPPEMVARPHLLSGAVQPLIVQQPVIGSPAWIAMIRFVLRGDAERWLQLHFEPNVEYQESGEPNVSGIGGWDTGNMRSFMGFWSTDEDWLGRQSAAAM